MNSRSRWAIAVVLAGALAVPLDQMRARALQRGVALDRYEDVYTLPPAPSLPWISLGYDQAFADVVWSQGLIYYGTELGHRGELVHVFDYADAMLTLDPEFRAAYLWAGTVPLYRTQVTTLNVGLRALTYLERAAQRWPWDGRLAWELGATMAYEVAPLAGGAEGDRMRARATEPLMRAEALGAAPAWMTTVTASMLARSGSKRRALRHLEESYQSVTDEHLRLDIARRIQNLRTELREVDSTDIVEQSVRFESERRRHFPYLSPDLFLLLGEEASLEQR